jgi:hypothetical protein
MRFSWETTLAVLLAYWLAVAALILIFGLLDGWQPLITAFTEP